MLQGYQFELTNKSVKERRGSQKSAQKQGERENNTYIGARVHAHFIMNSTIIFFLTIIVSSGSCKMRNNRDNESSVLAS